MARIIWLDYITNTKTNINKMEKREVLVPKPRASASLWVHFSFRPKNKGEPSIVEKEMQTNLKQHLHTHHPQQYSGLFFEVQKLIKLVLFIKVYTTIPNVKYSNSCYDSGTALRWKH